MVVGAKADEVPAIGVLLGSIAAGLGGVARLLSHSHDPSKVTIETRAMLNVRRTRTRLGKPNPSRPSILLTLDLPLHADIGLAIAV